MFVNPDFFIKVCVNFSYKYAGTNKQKKSNNINGNNEIQHSSFGPGHDFKLVAQIQQVSSDWVAVHWS